MQALALISAFIAFGCGGSPVPRDASQRPPSPRSAVKVGPPATTFAKALLAPESISLLGGRLRARFPTDARALVETDQEPGALVREERYRLEAGQEHLVAIVRELVARQSEDLEADVRAEVASWGQRPAELDVDMLTARSTALSVLRMVPSEPVYQGVQDGVDDMALVGALFVAHCDGTMQSIELHGDDAAVRERAGLVVFAARIGAALSIGERRLPLATGTKVFTVWRRGPELRIDLPTSCLALEVEDENTETYGIEPLRPMGGQPGRIAIRVGAILEEAVSQNFRGRRRPRLIRGRLLGQDVRWIPEAAESGARTLRTSLVAADFPLTVVLGATGDQEIRALREIAESMRLSQPCIGPGHCPAGERCTEEYCRVAR